MRVSRSISPTLFSYGTTYKGLQDLMPQCLVPLLCEARRPAVEKSFRLTTRHGTLASEGNCESLDIGYY
jgi:hypothetical protein